MSTIAGGDVRRTSDVAVGDRVLAGLRDYSVVVIVVGLFVVMSLTADNFFSMRNFMNILDANAPLMLVALGTTFVIMAGAFDLSTGQILSLGGVLSAWFAFKVGSPIAGILFGIAMGIPIGLLNGVLVGALRLNSFLTTLATGLVFGGVALLVVQGASIDLSADSTFVWLGSHRFGVVPVTAIISLIVFLVLWALLSLTVFGRQVQAVGSNPEAARLSGISIAKVMMGAFMLGGLAASLAGVLLVSKTGVGNTFGGASTLTLNAIAAVVIGGTSITGGRGAMWRTVFGVLLLALLQNALNLLNFEPFWQQIVSGLVILAAIVVNTLGSRGNA
jgi:ribose transport system permease protein